MMSLLGFRFVSRIRDLAGKRLFCGDDRGPQFRKILALEDCSSGDEILKWKKPVNGVIEGASVKLPKIA